MAFVSVDARSNFMYYRQEAGGRGGADLPPIWQYSPKVFKRSVPFSFLRQYESINMKS